MDLNFKVAKHLDPDSSPAGVELLRLFSQLQDDTSLAHQDLYEQNKFLKSIIYSEPDCVCVFNLNGQLLDINPAGLKLLGLQNQAFIPSLDLNSFILPTFLDTYLDMFQKVIDGETRVLELPIHTFHGELRWVEIHATPWKQCNHLVKGLIGIIRDITEIRRLRQELEEQARRDYLTGLYNRRHFMELSVLELSRAQRYQSKLSLLILDVDHFKKINDNFGHLSGDKVLKSLGDICMKQLRETDTVGRIGGEEFAAILPETSLQEAFDLSERLREAIAALEITLDDNSSINITVSIGVAEHQPQIKHLSQIMQMADRALYQAKACRNTVCIAAPR